MRILHVSLGLPPLRTGGLTRYCTEVMEEQAQLGNEVSLLFPGHYSHGKTRLIKGSWHGVATYEVVNPLPVALTYGVGEPITFCSTCDDPDAYRCVLLDVRPEVIHVHSFQGIHREFFQIAHDMRIPMVFTTHDYYPMCLRCTFITSCGENCKTGPSPEACAVCNLGVGMTSSRSRVMQSKVYALLKDSAFVRSVGARVKGEMSSDTSTGVNHQKTLSYKQNAEYKQALSYNQDIFSLLTLVLANSRMAMSEYRRFFPNARYCLLPITHAGLKYPNTVVRSRHDGVPLSIGFYGGRKTYKGFDTLLQTTKILSGIKYPFELHLYGEDYGNLPTYAHAINHGRINPESVCHTLSTLDVVVVPSKCHETFGFVVLEALCSGVPVICSDAIGAKDLVDESCVFHSGDACGLAKCITAISKGLFPPARVPETYPLSMNDQILCLEGAYHKASNLLGASC